VIFWKFSFIVCENLMLKKITVDDFLLQDGQIKLYVLYVNDKSNLVNNIPQNFNKYHL